MNILTNLDLRGRVLEVVKRFPVPVIFSIFTTIALIISIDFLESDSMRLAIAGFVGFLAVLNLSIAKESFKLENRTYYLLLAIISALLIWFFYNIPNDNLSDHTCFWFFSGGLSIFLHLLISVIPHSKVYDEVSFINYNTKLFIAWMQAALYGIILYLALCLAILALDNLFNIQFSYLIYAKLFILIGGVFHVFFFLSEIPDDFYTFKITIGKSIFKIITSYIFIPVVIVYGIILFAYLIKLILFSQFVDWVSAMIIIYFTLGILTYLFSCYFENDSEAAICKWFKKVFFIISGPLVALLFYVVYVNYTIHGITEDIYLSFLTAIFILIVSLYLLFKNNGDKRIFPLTFMFLTLFAVCFGPLSLCNLPISDAQKRLIKDFESMGLIKNDQFVFNDSISHQDTTFNIQNQLSFLEGRKKLDFLDKYDTQGFLKKENSDLSYYRIMNALNIRNNFIPDDENVFQIFNSSEKVIELKGFDKIIPIVNDFDAVSVNEYLKVENSLMKLVIGGNEIGTYNVADELYKLSQNQHLDQILEINIGQYYIRIHVISANGNNIDGSFKIVNLEGIALIKSINNE